MAAEYLVQGEVLASLVLDACLKDADLRRRENLVVKVLTFKLNILAILRALVLLALGEQIRCGFVCECDGII